MIQDLSKGYIGRATSGLIWPWTKAGWCSIRAATCLNNPPIGTKADHKEKWNVNMYNHTLKIFKMWCLPQQWTELVKIDPVNVGYQGKQRLKHCKYFRNRSRSQNFVVQCYFWDEELWEKDWNQENTPSSYSPVYIFIHWENRCLRKKMKENTWVPTLLHLQQILKISYVTSE